jgi:hypothetical protein
MAILINASARTGVINVNSRQSRYRLEACFVSFLIMEPENEPRPRHHQLAVYAHKGTPEVRLQQKQHHTVRDLDQLLIKLLLTHGKRSR